MTTKKLSEEEIKEMIKLESGSKMAEVAEGVFQKLINDFFKESDSKFDGKISKLIYGMIIATSLVLLGLVVSTWIFIASYHHMFLQSQQNFNMEFNDLRQENMQSQSKLEMDSYRIIEKQEYLEKILMDQAAKN